MMVDNHHRHHYHQVKDACHAFSPIFNLTVTSFMRVQEY